MGTFETFVMWAGNIIAGALSVVCGAFIFTDGFADLGWKPDRRNGITPLKIAYVLAFILVNAYLIFSRVFGSTGSFYASFSPGQLYALGASVGIGLFALCHWE